MRLIRIAVIVLLSIFVVSTLACDPLSTSEPTATPTYTPQIYVPYVSYVPSGWYLLDGNSSNGLIEYEATNSDFVMIWYYEVPSYLKEHDGNKLISYATEMAVFTPTEDGTTYVNGHLAGYVMMYDSDYKFWRKKVVFVNDDTCIEIYAVYTDNNSDKVNELIVSIQ
jgi:hypothetical protein